MKKTELLLLSLFAILSTAIWVSCSKSDSGSTNKTPSASIKDTSQTVNESAGTVSVIVNLSAAASQALKLNFALSGTAILNGDYEMDSTTSITIPAGSSSGTLVFRIFDDLVTEPSKTIHVKFTSTGNVTFTTSEATITIQDNDPSRASTGLQTDLTWDAGSLVDLDLAVANNVVIDSSQPSNPVITGFHLVDSSVNDKGFESVLIKNTNPDGKYYLIVAYVAGNRTVNVNLTSNGPNITNAVFPDVFTVADLNSLVFYGPINKVGSTYGRQSGAAFDLSQLKHYLYRGKIK
jgi:Calx-beta domain-containing protein